MPNGVGAFSHLAFPACLNQPLYADSLLLSPSRLGVSLLRLGPCMGGTWARGNQPKGIAMTKTITISGVLVGRTKDGVTTPCVAGTPSVRSLQAPRASHFLAYLRATYGNYEEAIRRFPEVRSIFEWASVALSGGHAHHRLPPERVFNVMADCPAPSLETIHKSLSALSLHPSTREVKKYLTASQMVTARVNRWLDKRPAWDHYEP